MVNKSTKSCPCSSGDSYQDCCQPFHGGRLAEDALQLMRSRFTAYALDIPGYLIKTTHPENPQYSDNIEAWRQKISQFSQSFSFNKLEILEFTERETLATVTFTAYITQGDVDHTFTERSLFVFSHDRWLYQNGHVAQGYAPQLALDWGQA